MWSFQTGLENKKFEGLYQEEQVRFPRSLYLGSQQALFLVRD